MSRTLPYHKPGFLDICYVYDYVIECFAMLNTTFHTTQDGPAIRILVI